MSRISSEATSSVIPKVPKLQSGEAGIAAYKESLRLHEHSLRNRFAREFYRKELTARAKLYETLGKKRPPGTDAATFFHILSNLHWEELTRYASENPPKTRKKFEAPTARLNYPDFPECLVHRIHFLEKGSLKRERSAELALHADKISRQEAPNGDILLSVAVSSQNVQLFERLVESIGADRLGVPYGKGGSFSGYIAADGIEIQEPAHHDENSPWARVHHDNFQARLYHWSMRRGQLDPSTILPTNFPPVPESLPWDPDPRFQAILKCTHDDRLEQAMALVEQIPAEDREVLFDEIIYLRFLLDQPIRGNDIRYLSRKYVSSSSISTRLSESFDRFVELLDGELLKAGPILANFPGLGDQAWLFANDPDPLKRNTPPLKDWRATREHYYLQYKAYGQPVRPRGRIFVWHPDIASGSSSSMQDSFAPQLAAAEDAFRRENGIPEIGQGWVSEVSLFSLVRSLFPDAVHQWRPPFLGLQSVDIYVPSAKLAIEYQGKQHYEAVKLFGGEEGLLSSQARDGRKRELFKANGIELIEWRYDQLISAGAVSAILARYSR